MQSPEGAFLGLFWLWPDEASPSELLPLRDQRKLIFPQAVHADYPSWQPKSTLRTQHIRPTPNTIICPAPTIQGLLIVILRSSTDTAVPAEIKC